MVNCPLCNGELDFEEDELDEGDEFTCDECGGTVRVTGLHPVELEKADDDDGDEEESGADDKDEEGFEEEEENEEEEW